MRAKFIAALAAIPALLALKKALTGLAIIPVTSEGMQVAAQGGDITPYIVALIGVAIAVALPIGLLQAVAEA